MLFLCYPKCSTCQKARKWLDEHGIKYTERHIVEKDKVDDSIMRVLSKEIASELMEITFGDNG